MPIIGGKKNLIGRKLKKPNKTQKKTHKTPKNPPGWVFFIKPGFLPTLVCPEGYKIFKICLYLKAFFKFKLHVHFMIEYRYPTGTGT
jgi:hypothetical protein